ncbi:hypothetical protein TVAG_064170 [Trichomonas vaginalis G3]|uniref:NOT2/NOT3/NOT5 C-terminal domain-containing protein n=1 Tax=Trichomonas vaginalis (strain ATCC PRA-98 / G3) TaxID=412133 RepID=A2FBX7_TRIV3|nr:NOT transcription complex subunit VIP2 family [Trichomonas vaginalis G3]EAX97576.1 hypothetical protein TVAG_064170 [Trichomonas vaginalis G3]KAI5516223.1 NOT transcription complex subunit VIP2 family [Trichomonas vaginalis G3]|eukprot:XP_001310506.1 hypothetical protein [Trichomonas vaginalis G3]
MSNKGYKPVDNLNGNQFYRQSFSPQIQKTQKFQFDYGNGQKNYQYTTNKGPKIEISHPKNSQFMMFSGGTKIEPKSQNPNPVIIQQAPSTPQPKDIFHLSIKKPSEQPVSDFIPKHSLAAYIAEYEANPSFNEVNLANLGIDVNTTQPLLPNLQSIVSDLPLGQKTSYPAPQAYSELAPECDLKQRLYLFNTSTLMYIFYTGNKRDMQDAAAELCRRGFTYDTEDDEWRNPNNVKFDTNTWKIPED